MVREYPRILIKNNFIMCFETTKESKNAQEGKEAVGLGGFTQQDADSLDKKVKQVIIDIDKKRLVTGGDLWDAIGARFNTVELKYIATHFILEKNAEVKEAFYGQHPLKPLFDFLDSKKRG